MPVGCRPDSDRESNVTINAAQATRIRRLADRHWQRHVRDSGFAEIVDGKEPGHRMADYVDDKTTALLKVELDTRYEGNVDGSIKKRSMGDIWVRANGVYNPVNVKSGLQDMRGQPNVVSMEKLLNYLFRRWIDSYYLLIVKFDMSERNEITHRVYFFDLLDWVDFITYDAGPGQIMLNERDFYHAYNSGAAQPPRSVLEKVERLFGLFERQVEALFENRRRRLRGQRTQLESFNGPSFIVDQSGMHFVP